MKYLVKEISEGNCDITLLPENLNDRNLLAETAKHLKEDFQKEIQFYYEDALKNELSGNATFVSLNFEESNYPKRVNVNYQIVQN
ncbi:hypothetical protein EZ449_03360 [Pedobacter frigidisoli]|uniref:Uncharacterized protein n=1 Tax=Pedobacter frigidisoli TaxID=2530455 RepID=A0A4R0PB38_9SPHI|nr:hypothetical protein [Pedobacter frigidisoli]TCD12075.1 hypothetical protein EZ449_03360 [Pedobacter frigidisoli]